MSQNASVTVQLTASPDAAKAAAALAAELKKAADAEEAYQKKLAKTLEMMRERARITADMVKAGVIADRKLTPEQAGRQVAGRADDRRLARQEALRLDPPQKRRSEMDPHERFLDASDRESQRRDDRRTMIQNRPDMKRAGEMSMDERVEKERARQSDKKEYDKRLESEGLKANPKSPLTVDERVEKERAHQADKKEYDAALVKAGLKKGDEPGRMAFSDRIGVIGSRISGAGAVAKVGIDAAIMSGTVEADPYMTEGQKSRRKLLDAPMVGRGVALQQAFSRTQQSGEEVRYQQAIRAGHLAQIDVEHGSRENAAQLTHGVDERLARDRAQEYKGYSAERMKSTDRAGVASERLYREDLRLLPLRQAEVEGTKQRILADKKVATIGGLEAAFLSRGVELRGELNKVIEAQTRLGSRTDGSVKADSQQLLEKEGALRAALSDNEDQGRTLTSRKSAAEGEAATARSGERKARGATAQERLDIAQDREAKVVSQAQTYGSSSGTELANAYNTILAYKTRGYEGLSQEQKGTLDRYAGDTSRKEKEKAGEQVMKVFRPMLPDEFPDTVAGATTQTNTAREQLAQLREKDAKQYAREMADATKGVMDAVVASFTRQLAEMKSKLQYDANVKNNATQ